MGVLDFREIRSPKLNHQTNMPIGVSSLPDDFELFCQEFFGIVRRMRIFKCVSSGNDGGIDLGVEETSEGGRVTRWLVSCKHKAHSDAPVAEAEEKNIIERVAAWECDGFIPFYTTVPAAKVETLITGLEKFGKRVERYSKERIERELLESPTGAKLAARYFPRSMVNHYGKIIETVHQYSIEDVTTNENIATVAGFSQYVGGVSKSELLLIKKQLANDANLQATMIQHAPYFVTALLDAIQLAPSYFNVKKLPSKLEDFRNVTPTWDPYSLYQGANTNGFSFGYFVAAVWSFWDWSRSNLVFAQMMAFRSEPIRNRRLTADEVNTMMDSDDFRLAVESHKAAGLLAPGLVGLKLQENTRDIVTRLFAFANVVPLAD
ncbi:MAG: hypothetical protein WC100_17255 [Sterolibacterium sp.]